MSSKRSKKKRRNIRNDSTKKSASQPVKTQQIQRESEESKLAFRRKVTFSFVVFVGIAALAVLFYLALAGTKIIPQSSRRANCLKRKSKA